MKLSEVLKGRGMISRPSNICQGWALTSQPQWLGCKIQTQLRQWRQLNVKPAWATGGTPDSKPCGSCSVSVAESSEAPWCSRFPPFTPEQPKTQGREAARQKANSPGNNTSRTRTHLALALKPAKCSPLAPWLERDEKRNQAKGSPASQRHEGPSGTLGS